MSHLFDAVVLSERLRSDFKAVADLLGPTKAFYVFATQVVKGGYDSETEKKFVEILKAVHDDYVERASVQV